MATIKEVKTQIQNANALGRQNLTEKGVEVEATATTYDIMTAIAEISGGGGVQYTDITYNEDNTITLTDKDGVEHAMSCNYEDGKLIGVTYDGKAVKLTYDGDVLSKVGKTAVDMANAQTSGIEPLDHTVTFMVDGEPYEVVSVKDGNSVNAPSGIPTSDEGNFDGWSLNGNTILFPYTPTEDVELIATFLSLIDTLYDRLNVDKETYPYILIKDNFYDGQHTYEAYVTKQKNLINSSGNFYFTGFYCMRSNTITFDNPDDAPIGVTNILRFIFDNYASTLEKPSGTHNHSVGETCTYYTNTDSKSDIGTWVKI